MSAVKFAVAVVLSAPLLAPVWAADAGQIVVTGEASRDIAPDEARLTARIDKRAADPQAAAQLAAKAMTVLLAKLEKLGVAAASIQALGTQVGPLREWDQDARKQRLLGYQAVRELRLDHLPLSLLGPIMQTLAESGVEQVGSPQLDLADRTGVELAVLMAAAKDAEQKAQALAKSLGVGVGRPVAIDANPGAGPSPGPVAFKAMRAEAADVGQSYSHAGLIEIHAQVRVAFAIQ